MRALGRCTRCSACRMSVSDRLEGHAMMMVRGFRPNRCETVREQRWRTARECSKQSVKGADVVAASQIPTAATTDMQPQQQQRTQSNNTGAAGRSVSSKATHGRGAATRLDKRWHTTGSCSKMSVCPFHRRRLAARVGFARWQR